MYLNNYYSGDFSHLPSYLGGEKISEGRPALLQLISTKPQENPQLISKDEQNSIDVMAHRLNVKLGMKLICVIFDNIFKKDFNFKKT